MQVQQTSLDFRHSGLRFGIISRHFKFELGLPVPKKDQRVKDEIGFHTIFRVRERHQDYVNDVRGVHKCKAFRRADSDEILFLVR